MYIVLNILIDIMKFSELNIDKKIISSLNSMDFIEMTNIQEKVIPFALKGKDLIARAMTGSGKTAAFGIPICEIVEKGKSIQAIVVGPTRELVLQVSLELEKFSKNKGLNVVTIFGGVSMQPQYNKLKKANIVVGTPGRMLDHMKRGSLNIRNIKILVLDEADRMLDMGFIDDIKKIISQTPKNRQTMLFSATMSRQVKNIAGRFMNYPVNISGENQVSKNLLKHYYFDVKQEHKLSLLEYLIKKEKPTLAIIFCATRNSADFVANKLKYLKINANSIHGGFSQDKRLKILEKFQNNETQILVATDVAARGLDIKNVSHIFNYNLPKKTEDFTHRIGRTARFGKTGKTFSLLSKEEHSIFRKIVNKISITKLKTPHDFFPKKFFLKPNFNKKQNRFKRY